MNIKTILNKQSWTGEEIGKLYIKVMADLYKQGLSGVANPQPLVPFDQLQTMVNSLSLPQYGKTFNGYNAIYTWITAASTTASSNEQQLYFRLKTLTNYLQGFTAEEDHIYRYIAELPVVMTKKQHEAFKKESIHNFLYTTPEETGEEEPLTDDIADIILRAISFYAAEYRLGNKNNNPLSKIRDKYIKEPITSAFILKNYNYAIGNGYYTLPDGRRSDKMSKEDWLSAVMPEDLIRAANSEDKELQRSVAAKNYFRNCLNDYNELTEEEAYRKNKEAAGLPIPTWHTYEEPPEGLVKWELITDDVTLMECYPNAFYGKEDKEKSLAELIDFVAEFREAIDAIIEDIDSKYYNLLFIPTGAQAPLIPSLASIPVEDWGKFKFKWNDLYSANAYGTRDAVESPEILYRDNKRARVNGVAILEDETKDSYTEPKHDLLFPETSLEQFYTDSEDYAEAISVIGNCYGSIEDSYYYVTGFNAALKAMAEYYSCEDFLAFTDTIAQEEAEKRINAYNTMITLLYSRIKNTDYENSSLKLKRLAALKDNFPLIDVSQLQPEPERLEELKENLKDFVAFNRDTRVSGRSNWIAKLLFIRPDDKSGTGGAYTWKK